VNKAALDLVREDAAAVLNGRVPSLQALKGAQFSLTGGTGFLGTWLLELIARLNEEHGFGIRVWSLSRGAKAFALKWPHLASQPWLRLVEGDIRYLAELPRETQYLVHAAALTDRRICASNPSLVGEVNTVGAMRVLRAANLLEDLRKGVFLSSGLAVGRQAWELQAIDENHSGPVRCDRAESVYAESKRMAEVLAQCAISEWKAPLVTLRPFAFVGPYQSLELPWAVTDFMRDSLRGGPIRIMGDGATVRSILYAADFAYAVLAVLAHGKSLATYHVGSDEAVDLLSLARLIAGHFTPMPEIRTGLGQAGHERTRLVPSIQRLRNELGFAPRFTVAAALERSLEWHRMMERG